MRALDPVAPLANPSTHLPPMRGQPAGACSFRFRAGLGALHDWRGEFFRGCVRCHGGVSLKSRLARIGQCRDATRARTTAPMPKGSLFPVWFVPGRVFLFTPKLPRLFPAQRQRGFLRKILVSFPRRSRHRFPMHVTTRPFASPPPGTSPALHSHPASDAARSIPSPRFSAPVARSNSFLLSVILSRRD